jgi:hypothetical protein
MRTLVLCVVAMATWTGCGTKKEIDQKVDLLIATLESGDYSRFKTFSAPELSKVLPEAKFKTFAKIVQRLGAYQARTMHGISIQAGGVHQGTYTLVFDKAQAELEVTSKNGLLVGFNLSGDAVRRVLQELEDEQYAEFKVASFQFLDEKKQPKPSNVYKVGQSMAFRMEVYGVTYKEGAVHARCRLKIVDADKIVVGEFPSFLDQVMRPENKQRVVTVKGDLKVPRAGSYRLQLTYTDVYGGERTLEHAVAVIVE